ncbi:TIGR02594 family protein [Piscinibacter gummiphilus]|uniref:TIGR02594 family protein n=1 Tax=Piscinibacter gummiphilus TaxID=946333 RepID=A0ABZ0CNR6_9BURK|nr:TIGR02594 family protein [Piscinibacter gummiphilus]WOB06488.1 TIGR02594 family protein [Piscinibacter gummiphilus]
MRTEPAWLVEARKELGVHEIKGPVHEQRILQMWKDSKLGGIKNDEVPWCAAFINACLERAGIRSARTDGAKNYLTWGVRLSHPAVGAIGVRKRPGGFHVFFVLGRDGGGNIAGIGGNESDQVLISTHDKAYIAGYVWPASVPLPAVEPLPPITAAMLRRAD